MVEFDNIADKLRAARNTRLNRVGRPSGEKARLLESARLQYQEAQNMIEERDLTFDQLSEEAQRDLLLEGSHLGLRTLSDSDRATLRAIHRRQLGLQ